MPLIDLNLCRATSSYKQSQSFEFTTHPFALYCGYVSSFSAFFVSYSLCVRMQYTSFPYFCSLHSMFALFVTLLLCVPSTYALRIKLAHYILSQDTDDRLSHFSIDSYKCIIILLNLPQYCCEK